MKIVVFGLGAIGSNLLIQLMKQYPDFEFVGIDYDKIEERNIKTQAFFLEQVGMPKASAIPIVAARFIRRVRYTPINKKIDVSLNDFVLSTFKQDVLKDTNYLFLDCFDNTASRRLLTRKQDDNVLHIGFSPFYTAELLWQKDYDVPGDVDKTHNDICSMTEAVSFIHYVVNFSVMVISKWLTDKTKSNYIISKFKQREL